MSNPGLLVITTRQALPELDKSKPPRVVNTPLDRLSTADGVELLVELGVHGRQGDMEAAVEEVAGHALSVTLLGTYLDALEGGDVRRRDHLEGIQIAEALEEFGEGDETARMARRLKQPFRWRSTKKIGLGQHPTPETCRSWC